MKNASSSKPKIVLAFSGGLDTSAIIPWLIETYKADVYACAIDLGNSPDAKELKEWAFKLGAKDFIFEDVKESFASDFIFPALKAGAVYQDDYLLGTALARPLISERVVAYAKKVGATHLAHGATGKGNDQLRFEKSWSYLAPEMEIIAPWKIWEFKGRTDLLKYMATKGIPMEAKEKVYSVDANLLHRSCEGGILENPAKGYETEAIYELVRTPAKSLMDRVLVELEFNEGKATKLNHKSLTPAALVTELNKIAGDYGVGVIDLVEERANGIKSRGVYETPGGTLLSFALKQLKHLCWDRKLQNTARQLGQTYGDLIYDGDWHSDLKAPLDGFFNEASQFLTGKVSLLLEHGKMRVYSRESPYSLYNEASVSFEGDNAGLLKDAVGFSRTLCHKAKLSGKRAALLSKDS